MANKLPVKKPCKEKGYEETGKQIFKVYQKPGK
jgi:hypothetical protein